MTHKRGEVRRLAYTALINDNGVIEGGPFCLGIAEEGVKGYIPAKSEGSFDTLKDAEDQAEELNSSLGLDRRTASEIVLTTM